MKRVAWLAALALGFFAVAFANEKLPALDGTSWKVEVGPDAMAKAKGEKEYKETLTFADGVVSMTEAKKLGFESAPYEVTKSGQKDLTFKTEQESEATGRTIWTGTIHEKSISGKMIMTRKGGDVLTYTFKGNKLD